MRMKRLTNPSKANVVSFPIEEAQFDSYGEVMLDSTNNYMKTGRTLEWTLMAGESLEFPSYVADYLKKVYDFLVLENIDTPTTVVTPQETPQTATSTQTFSTKVEDKIPAQLICRGCGKSFGGSKAIALHMAALHPELLV